MILSTLNVLNDFARGDYIIIFNSLLLIKTFTEKNEINFQNKYPDTQKINTPNLLYKFLYYLKETRRVQASPRRSL